MTSLKTSIKTITYLSDIGCLEIQGASLMSKQDYFENSLDVEENIISLCCNCHKQIHLGKGFEDMLRKIYAERKDVLKKAGIEILLEDLILFYKMEGN
ncbi:DNA methylase [Escherichia coli]|nr:DNA methylase [Escherichia coli]